MKRGVSCMFSNAPTKGVTARSAAPKPSSVQEPSKVQLESATHKYRVQRGTRAPLTDCLTMNHGRVESVESYKQADSKAHTPENKNKNKNEMPSLWRISGTSKAYQESATAKWRNKTGKSVD